MRSLDKKGMAKFKAQHSEEADLHVEPPTQQLKKDTRVVHKRPQLGGVQPQVSLAVHPDGTW